MDSIVRNFEEIELTEAELEVIYGAGDVTDIWDPHTQAVFTGGITVTSYDQIGTVAFGSTVTDTNTFAGTAIKTLS
jgi:hypothetical protein